MAFGTHLVRNVIVEMPRVGWIGQVRLVWRPLHMDIWKKAVSVWKARLDECRSTTYCPSQCYETKDEL